MGQREGRRGDAGVATKVDLSITMPCRWPPKREYSPARKHALAALPGYLPLVVPAR